MLEEIIQYIHSHWVAGVFSLIALALSKGYLRLSKQMTADMPEQMLLMQEFWHSSTTAFIRHVRFI